LFYTKHQEPGNGRDLKNTVIEYELKGKREGGKERKEKEGKED
jgi:hypothetical protein